MTQSGPVPDELFPIILYGSEQNRSMHVGLLGTAAGVRMTQLPSPRGRRVLIIEDQFFALDLEATMFKLGFEVCALAPSARKARSLAMNDQPDVALVDVYLEGGREGIEIARWLREVCEVPIVFVTAQTDEDTVERIHEQVPGAPVLSKPVFRHTLASAVEAVTKH
jgi:response regulator of citrate/malate metabolism